MKTVQDLMKNCNETCSQNENIESVGDKMSSSRLNSLVVLDEQNIVVGTVSYLDICIAPFRIKKEAKRIKVSEVMSPNVFTINTFDDETLALNLMRQFHINTLPVVDKDNKLKGTIRFMTLARRIISFKRRFNINNSASLHSELA